MAKYSGSCHCGATKFEVEGELGAVIDCNCSHCSRKGYLLWFVPRAQFSLKTDESALADYYFNKHVIRHTFCKTCGCAPFGFGKDREGNEIAAINARCLEDVEIASLERRPFDGRSQ